MAKVEPGILQKKLHAAFQAERFATKDRIVYINKMGQLTP